MDVSADRAVSQRFGADKFDSVEEIHQNLVDLGRALPDLFLDSRGEIELAEGANLETPLELDVAMALLQMGDVDQAHDSDLENSVASVFAHKQVDSQSGHTLLNLDVDPDKVLAVHEHE